MVFARNRTGQIVAAQDLPAMSAPNFHCASCGSQVSLLRPDRAHAYFRHACAGASILTRFEGVTPRSLVH